MAEGLDPGMMMMIIPLHEEVDKVSGLLKKIITVTMLLHSAVEAEIGVMILIMTTTTSLVVAEQVIVVELTGIDEAVTDDLLEVGAVEIVDAEVVKMTMTAGVQITIETMMTGIEIGAIDESATLMMTEVEAGEEAVEI